MDWETANWVASSVQGGITALAVVAGGAWAYYRFVRFRTLRPRLSFSFGWRLDVADGSPPLGVLTLKLRNTGNTKVHLKDEGRHRCFLKYGLIRSWTTCSEVSLASLPASKLEHLDAVFLEHSWIEPSETIDDVRVIRMPSSEVRAVQFQTLLFASRLKWSATAAFPVSTSPSHDQHVSEDFQAPYEQAEAIGEELASLVVRADRALSEAPEEEGARLKELIERAETAYAALFADNITKAQIKEGTVASRLLEMALR